ncbi:hypothetical protein ACBP89_22945 [Aneurinibacillus aneurinilyticus]|uniref:hypothetical protein n=1 Tax=Aneurinibacillus aneurinilyticus TaxID=1391 RepID=UPI0035256A9E
MINQKAILIKELKNEKEWKEAYPVMKQLRTHLDEDQFLQLIQEAAQKEDIQQVQQVSKASWNYAYEGIIPFEIQKSFLKFAYNDEMMQKRFL